MKALTKFIRNKHMSLLERRCVVDGIVFSLAASFSMVLLYNNGLGPIAALVISAYITYVTLRYIEYSYRHKSIKKQEELQREGLDKHLQKIELPEEDWIVTKI